MLNDEECSDEAKKQIESEILTRIAIENNPGSCDGSC